MLENMENVALQKFAALMHRSESSMSSPPSLPQHDGAVQKAERALQLGVAQQIYAYNAPAGLPMPMAVERAAAAQAIEILDWVTGWLANQARIFADLEIWKYETGGNPDFAALADYTKVFTLFSAPDVIETWQDDRVFGAQRLAGLNPLAVTLVTAGSTHEGLSWSVLRPKLAPAILNAKFGGRTLADLLGEGRLYVTDFASLQGVVPDTYDGVRQFQMAPVALYVKPTDFAGLVPLAIQLTQNPSDGYVYLAPQGGQNQTDYRWLMAKSYLQCADL